MITSETTWTSYDGHVRAIKDLEDTHLANVIAWVQRHEIIYPTELLQVLKDEAERRGLKPAFLDRAEIPYRDQEGHWTLNFERVG